MQNRRRPCILRAPNTAQGRNVLAPAPIIARPAMLLPGTAHLIRTLATRPFQPGEPTLSATGSGLPCP
ncbi:hypothetical protein C4K05_2246 [Pseudomonas chlororaphis subsp. aureofaciens]|uniref:Uncharacterized protein n=1 Tax=Pseudomonas chlororaphis subsp. aureofaciens TaxID=587851 RepID=A0AAD0ZD60_9PSED|nr:hypothetical protein C4K12_2215 [Pseudomonas chlororaphis subsp. aureofaciens]AZE16519.1 hypothetical protein C4K09_2058 [Pseudomonas chlororaphis subsp. aureofaciens]AZE28927.1 hypothetical protein C4K07_2142 [Pseudomonas chlororaphis subsp. aureofaciens]AZE35178.1 hypothetical protein C4K06_2145 [Pseudomonas chlororaphis subsp. aureofaciens]AZE41586.1 hypothetical protein C4K05_2246 [Pseudomonas chlororaphis subsp. aureofaciens]